MNGQYIKTGFIRSTWLDFFPKKPNTMIGIMLNTYQSRLICLITQCHQINQKTKTRNYSTESSFFFLFFALKGKDPTAKTKFKN